MTRSLAFTACRACPQRPAAHPRPGRSGHRLHDPRPLLTVPQPAPVRAGCAVRPTRARGLKLRTALEERGTGYPRGGLLARSHHWCGEVPHPGREGTHRAWQKLSAGAGARGHRFYNRAVIDLADPRPGSRQLLIRRNRSDGELAHYGCFSPASVPMTRAGRSRWIRMAGGAVLPVGQGPGRARRAPGPSLHLLVPLGHPRHARARLPRRRGRRPTRPRQISSSSSERSLQPTKGAGPCSATRYDRHASRPPPAARAIAVQVIDWPQDGRWDALFASTS
jgi:hypothetical protein